MLDILLIVGLCSLLICAFSPLQQRLRAPRYAFVGHDLRGRRPRSRRRPRVVLVPVPMRVAPYMPLSAAAPVRQPVTLTLIEGQAREVEADVLVASLLPATRSSSPAA